MKYFKKPGMVDHIREEVKALQEKNALDIEMARGKKNKAFTDYENAKATSKQAIAFGNLDSYTEAEADAKAAGEKIDLFTNYERALQEDPLIPAEEYREKKSQLVTELSAITAEKDKLIKEKLAELKQIAEEYSTVHNAMALTIRELEGVYRHEKMTAFYPLRDWWELLDKEFSAILINH